MNNLEARDFIKKMMEGYLNRKHTNNLYSKEGFIPENVITTYYEFVLKPEFSFIVNEYKKQFVYNESRVEKNITKEELLGLASIYDYIESFDFNNDYFNIFTTSLLLHQKLYSHCPNPHFGGSLRDCDVYLYDLPIDIKPCEVAKKEFNSFIAKSNDIFLPLKEGDIFEYINQTVKLTTYLIYLQPFRDGNKRTFRALENLLLKRISLPPIYIDINERDEYKKSLVTAICDKDYNPMIRFYYYKICDAIMLLDINRSEITDVSNNKIKVKK